MSRVWGKTSNITEKMSYRVSAHYAAETNMKNRLKADAKPSVGILPGRNRPSYQTNDKESLLIVTIYLLFIAEEWSSHMQPQYSSPYQAAVPALEYVGVGRRLLAIIIDGIILSIVNWIIDVVFHLSVVMTVDGDAWDRFTRMGPAAALQIIIPLVYLSPRHFLETEGKEPLLMVTMQE